MANAAPTDRPLSAQVLIVEDELDHAEVMADALKRPGHICTIVGGLDDALAELKGGLFDVIVTDLRMPAAGGTHGAAQDGGDAGLIVLRAARDLQPQAETVMVTAHGDVPTARAAFKDGAYDFIEKPLDLEVFRNLINRAAETVLLRGENARLKDELDTAGFGPIIAESEPMRRVLATVRTVARSTIPVLITGESGTGKELIAQAVHAQSKRASGRYVAFNCAGQSETLIEDQLFGHVRGAFTGADKDREGVFEYADGGTLFLDEIGDMPLTMQAKLLRVLESKEVVRLGANDPRKVDVRFVSATNRDLRAMVGEETFREDLFFRINAAHIHLPPLRDRREDVPPIARAAAARYAQEMADEEQSHTVELTHAALMRLTAFDWPGNVRQLVNTVQNMVVIALGEHAGSTSAEPGPVQVDVRHIPDEIRAADHDGEIPEPSGTGSLAGTSLEQIEKRAIRETLKLTGGNRERAAQLLGIGERTLYRKLKEYGLR